MGHEERKRKLAAGRELLAKFQRAKKKGKKRKVVTGMRDAKAVSDAESVTSTTSAPSRLYYESDQSLSSADESADEVVPHGGGDRRKPTLHDMQEVLEEHCLLEEKLSEKEAALSCLQEELHEKGASLSCLQKNLSEKEASLSCLQKNLSEKEASLSCLQKNLSEKEASLSGLQKELSEKEASLSGL
ncbi:PREDICTED: A-kinase anchor protein 9-like [Priapulus caudatus]|uniref:A-kinase anchor protein 9-like n=1 Tax=Priapulus caudatus TaxID=37621 RepID=A0ABM1DW91_PRICU|nr:PREDICTED: A-kinase anchor protein 9-like [Priapulus caudatus]